MSRRSRIVGFGSAGLLVLAGGTSAAIFSGTLGQNLAFALVALGLVLATALVFYEVGLTEDRDRAREQRAADRERRAPGTQRPKATGRLSRPGMDRSRARPRRLR